MLSVMLALMLDVNAVQNEILMTNTLVRKDVNRAYLRVASHRGTLDW